MTWNLTLPQLCQLPLHVSEGVDRSQTVFCLLSPSGLRKCRSLTSDSTWLRCCQTSVTKLESLGTVFQHFDGGRAVYLGFMARP